MYKTPKKDLVKKAIETSEDVLVGIVGLGYVLGHDVIGIPIMKTYGKLMGIEYDVSFNEDNGFLELVRMDKFRAIV
jgi:hypothetical protein